MNRSLNKPNMFFPEFFNTRNPKIDRVNLCQNRTGLSVDQNSVQFNDSFQNFKRFKFCIDFINFSKNQLNRSHF
jgi:hypothetical protein